MRSVRINFIWHFRMRDSIVNCSKTATNTQTHAWYGRRVLFHTQACHRIVPDTVTDTPSFRSHHQIRLVQSAPNIYTHALSRLLTECRSCRRRRSVRSFTHQLIRLIHSGRKYKMRYRRTPYTQSFLTRHCVQTRNHKPKLWMFQFVLRFHYLLLSQVSHFKNYEGKN